MNIPLYMDDEDLINRLQRNANMLAQELNRTKDELVKMQQQRDDALIALHIIRQQAQGKLTQEEWSAAEAQREQILKSLETKRTVAWIADMKAFDKFLREQVAKMQANT